MLRELLTIVSTYFVTLHVVDGWLVYPQSGATVDPRCSSTYRTMFRDAVQCNKYYWCVYGRPVVMYCRGGLVFNAAINACDWPFNVDCRDTTYVFPSHPYRPTNPTSPDFPSHPYRPTNPTSPVRIVHPSALRPLIIPAPTSRPRASVATTTPPSSLKPESHTVAPSNSTNEGCKRRVCYYTNWAQYRKGSAKFTPNDIDPSLCTHIMYAFAKLEDGQLAAFEWNDDSTEWSTGMYEKVMKLKRKNPSLKVLLALGGWNMGTATFTEMVETHASRENFADKAVTFLTERNFDGLDLDIEYPGSRGSPPQDKARFTLLVELLRAKFNAASRPLMLTAAVGAGKATIDKGYEVAKISKSLDFICLMSYDFNGAWDENTGHTSPLYAMSDADGDEKYFNLDYAAKYWVSLGCPAEKLVIGLATYGRSFTLSSSNSGLGAPATAGKKGEFTNQEGILAYYEVCKMMTSSNVKWIDDQQVPYIVEGKQWIGFENATSLEIKTNYVKDNGYGGVMVWSLDFDDFSNVCGQGKYPLWTAVNQICQV